MYLEGEGGRGGGEGKEIREGGSRGRAGGREVQGLLSWPHQLHGYVPFFHGEVVCYLHPVSLGFIVAIHHRLASPWRRQGE